jgi:hypothetical protein
MKHLKTLIYHQKSGSTTTIAAPVIPRAAHIEVEKPAVYAILQPFSHESETRGPMKTTPRSLRYTLATVFVLFSGVCAAHAVEIRIPAAVVGPGESVTLPVSVDRVDNLAGLKLVARYDKETLDYVKMEKTAHTASLMHVVNDRQPGTLVVVMAGARGIRGEDMPLFLLTFTVRASAVNPSTTQIAISEVQLMSDDLKTLPYSVDVQPLAIGEPGKRKE